MSAIDRTHKLCPRCAVVKARDDFGPNRARHDKLASVCRQCRTTRDAERYHGDTAYREKTKARVRAYQRRVKYRWDVPTAREFAQPAPVDQLGRAPVAWDPPGEANPELVGRVRNVLCVHYDHCLSVCVGLNWLGFACTGCTAYKRISDAQLLAEGEALARDRRAA